MSEIIDLVDINNVVIGTTDVDTAHELKQIHRVDGALLFDEIGNLCLHYWAVYEGILPIDWKFTSTDEVKSVIRMPMRDVSENITASPEMFTHGFLNVFTEYIRVK